MVAISIYVKGLESLNFEEEVLNGIREVIKTATIMQTANLRKGVYQPIVDITKRTGNLGKWYMQIGEYNGIVYSDVIYSIFLDSGTRHITARRFLEKSITKTKDELERLTINV